MRLSGPRVRLRVAGGGHDVPVAKLAERYERLWPLVVETVPLTARTVFWDNSVDDGPLEVVASRYGIADYPSRWPVWAPRPLTAPVQVVGGSPHRCGVPRRIADAHPLPPASTPPMPCAWNVLAPTRYNPGRGVS
jgi:hypothetical protein